MTGREKLGIGGAIGALLLAAIGVWLFSVGFEAKVLADMYIGFGIVVFGQAAILGFLAWRALLDHGP